MKQNYMPNVTKNIDIKYTAIVAVLIPVIMFLFQTTMAQTDTIAATVTANNLAVSVTDGTVTYGSVSLNTATTTANNGFTQVATNDGSDGVLNVKTSNATGGTSWVVNASPGSDLYLHEVSTTTGSSYVAMTTVDTYVIASSSMKSLLTQNLDFQLTTPTASTDFAQKSITITVQMAAS